jgi:hypothetical protein
MCPGSTSVTSASAVNTPPARKARSSAAAISGVACFRPFSNSDR